MTLNWTMVVTNSAVVSSALTLGIERGTFGPLFWSVMLVSGLSLFIYSWRALRGIT